MLFNISESYRTCITVFSMSIHRLLLLDQAFELKRWLDSIQSINHEYCDEHTQTNSETNHCACMFGKKTLSLPIIRMRMLMQHYGVQERRDRVLYIVQRTMPFAIKVWCNETEHGVNGECSEAELTITAPPDKSNCWGEFALNIGKQFGNTIKCMADGRNKNHSREDCQCDNYEALLVRLSLRQPHSLFKKHYGKSFAPFVMDTIDKMLKLLNVKTIYLTDTSRLRDQSCSLRLLKIVHGGCSWYDRFGYKPAHDDDVQAVRKFINFLQTTTVAQVLAAAEKILANLIPDCENNKTSCRSNPSLNYAARVLECKHVSTDAQQVAHAAEQARNSLQHLGGNTTLQCAMSSMRASRMEALTMTLSNLLPRFRELHQNAVRNQVTMKKSLQLHAFAV